MQINLGEDEQPEIGLIALIDCIFFLLMFFMVSTSFSQQTAIQGQRELSIVLPEASANLDSSAAAEEVIAISVDKKGGLFLQGEPISISRLQDYLKNISRENKQILIELAGDEAVSYKHIISVIDVCQFEGLTNIALQTKNK
jgi:biopolymer transport protein ExbD